MQSEPSDGSEKLQTVVKVLRDFKAAYNQHRCVRRLWHVGSC